MSRLQPHHPGFQTVISPDLGMRSIYLYKWHSCGWIKHTHPGGNDGLETGIVGGCGRENSVVTQRLAQLSFSELHMLARRADRRC